MIEASIEDKSAMNSTFKYLAASSKITNLAFKILAPMTNNSALLLKCVLYIYHQVQF